MSANFRPDKYMGGHLPKEINDEILEEFIKEEIALTKTCSCELCVFRKNMFRRMQEILKERRMRVD